MESTFSHDSKLDLLRQAQSLGYGIMIHHVNVDDAEISVRRVKARVGEGGHDVPEDKIRERYFRNQQIIRTAALMADAALVYDNSALNQKLKAVLKLRNGAVTFQAMPLPPWAKNLYGDLLAPPQTQ